jgi:hypothetical protein
MHEPFWNSVLSSKTRQQLCVQAQNLPPNTAVRNVPANSTNQKKRKAPSCDGIKYIPSSDTKNRNIKGCSYIIRLHFTLTELHGGREIGMHFLMANIFR